MSKKLKIKFSIRSKMLLGFIIIGILSTTIVGAITYNTVYKHELTNLNNKLTMIAELASREIDGNLHSELKPGDETNDNYTNMLKKLRDFKRISGLTYLYTFKPLSNQKVQFVLDTDESEDAAKIGDEYPSENIPLDPEIISAFKGTITVTKVPYADDWGTFLSGFAPVKNSKGEIVAIVGADISISALTDIQKTLLIFILGGVLISLLLSILIALFISYKISRPVLLMVNQLEDIVKNSGDLTQSIKIKTGDEIEVLAVKTNALLSNIKEIVLKIRATTVNIKHDSTEISDGIESTAASFETVSMAMGDIAMNASDQANIIEISTDKLKILSNNVDTLSENSNAISLAAKEAITHTDKGSEAINNLKDNFKLSQEIISSVSETVKQLEDKSIEIVKIIQVITNISSQTNLLALNAAIEAARAGEHGKGFAVVADEIRKLAENTTASAKEISSHIGDVRTQSQNTVDAMNKIINSISNQSVSIENTNTVLEQISYFVNKITNNIFSIDNAVKEVFNQKEEILIQISNICISSSSMVAATEEVTASSEEQNAVIEGISYKLLNLKETADDLGNIVSKFKV